MNISVEMPKDALITSRTELKEVIRELYMEINVEMSSEDILTIRETAEYLKISVPTVRNFIANKDIPFFQRGQVIRLNRRDLMEWMRTNTTYQLNRGRG